MAPQAPLLRPLTAHRIGRTVSAIMSIRTVPFRPTHASAAARMFVAAFEELRRRVPALPADLADVDVVRERLARMSGVAALEDDRLLGYLTSWFPIDQFRGTDRTGAYVPEWAHGAAATDRRAIYNALYRAASTSWARARCEVHAITLLAEDDDALRTWSWSGFGMGTVDAIRPMTPLEASTFSIGSVRMASPADAPALATLDLEHVRHYADAPVLMPPPELLDEQVVG